jgi:hypothetical protein
MTERPAEGLCPVCGTTFSYIYRAQGGGTRKKYCSPKCRSKDWARGNGGKRQATVIKYDSVPENKARKRERTRAATLKRYGWTEVQFQQELERQNYSCYGCLQPIDEQTAVIDHCHATDKTRGLLCKHCNWALGHVKDAPSTLRRLMAYLERDRAKPLLYIIGALKNSRIPEIGSTLRAEGFDVMDEWFTPGPEADENWQKYERQRGRSYAEALKGRAATNIFLFDRSYIDLADYVVLVMPAGKSAMLELGYAKGRGKKAYILLDGQDPDRYDVMPAVADEVFETVDDLLTGLDNKRLAIATKEPLGNGIAPPGTPLELW